MIRSYLPALVFLGLGASLGLIFVTVNSALGKVIGRNPAPRSQGDPYECGLPSEIKQNFRFGISFYLVAMLFILFDIETILLYPVALQLGAFGDVRADRDDRLHRPAADRLRVRLAERGIGMEVTRHQLGSGANAEFRARQLRARDMLRGDLEGPELERHVEQSVLTTTLEKAGRWAVGNANFPLSFGLACCAIEWMSHIGPRDRHRALRLRGRPRDAAPGRHDLPVGPHLDQDGAGHPAHLRADARAALRDRDGRLLVVDGRVQQLRARPRRQVPARSTCTCPAARRGRSRSRTASSSCAPRSSPTPTRAGARRYGGRGTEEVVADLQREDPDAVDASTCPAGRAEPECLTPPASS